jgi:hypothetical protein
MSIWATAALLGRNWRYGKSVPSIRSASQFIIA